jgi:hypothetical protein
MHRSRRCAAGRHQPIDLNRSIYVSTTSKSFDRLIRIGTPMRGERGMLDADALA